MVETRRIPNLISVFHAQSNLTRSFILSHLLNQKLETLVLQSFQIVRPGTR